MTASKRGAKMAGRERASPMQRQVLCSSAASPGATFASSPRLRVRLPVEAQYQVGLRDHAGEFFLRIEHRNMVMAISGE